MIPNENRYNLELRTENTDSSIGNLSDAIPDRD